MAKATQYRDMSTAELKSALEETRGTVFHEINERNRSKKSEKPHLLRQHRKDIARMLTILQEKSIEQN